MVFQGFSPPSSGKSPLLWCLYKTYRLGCTFRMAVAVWWSQPQNQLPWNKKITYRLGIWYDLMKSYYIGWPWNKRSLSFMGYRIYAFAMSFLLVEFQGKPINNPSTGTTVTGSGFSAQNNPLQKHSVHKFSPYTRSLKVFFCDTFSTCSNQWVRYLHLCWIYGK